MKITNAKTYYTPAVCLFRIYDPLAADRAVVAGTDPRSTHKAIYRIGATRP